MAYEIRCEERCDTTPRNFQVFDEEAYVRCLENARRADVVNRTNLTYTLVLQRAYFQFVTALMREHGGARDDFSEWLSSGEIIAIDGVKAPSVADFETAEFREPKTVKSLLSEEDFSKYCSIMESRKAVGA